MRKLLFGLLLLLGVFLLLASLTEVEAIVGTLQHGDWRFIALAVGVEAIWILNVAASYRAIFSALDLEDRFSNLLLVAGAVNFANVVAPSAGMGGVAIFVSEARRHKYSPARATVAGALYVLLDYAGFLCVLSLGLVVLLRRHTLTAPELSATGILLVIATFLGALLYMGMRSTTELGNFLAWMARQVNRLVRLITQRDYLSEQRAHEFAADAAQGLAELHRNTGNLFLPAALALTNKALLISVLLLVFLAFNVPLSIGTLIAGFSIGYLFLIVSPTPSGIGFVEGALTLALGSMYVPLGAAAVITLAYRGITFWLPLAYGGFALRMLHR